jgi:fructose-specific PTS system IIB-like component
VAEKAVSEEVNMNPKSHIVAVTACISGVAYTYMAAEKLHLLAKKLGYLLQVETQGALGIESPLDAETIARADLVVLCADINIEGIERFEGCRFLHCPTHVVLKTPDIVASNIQRLAVLPQGTVLTL